MARVRLDNLLTERGLYASRSRAAAAVIAGDVHLGPGRRRAEKPGQMVAPDVEVDVVAPPPYVSRGGIKLANALDALGVEVAGRHALDVGASTGGFTDCLLQRGAAHVVALDVAYGELALTLRDDARVTVIERANARALDAGRAALPARPRRRRRLVHLAHEGPAGGARVLRAGVRRARDGQAAVRGRARSRSARAASCTTRRCGARRWWAWRPRRSPRARRCSGSRRPGCPARRATARRSRGWPRGAARARSTTSRPRRGEVEP